MRTEFNPFTPRLPAAPLAVDGRARLLPLNGGDDIQSILGILANLAGQYGQNPDVRRAAEYIIESARNNDIAMNARKLAYFVRAKVRYLSDPDNLEFVKSPLVMLSDIATNGFVYGDCDDHVLLFTSLAKSIGLTARILGVKLNHDYYDHVIASWWTPAGWIDFDLCAKDGQHPFYAERMVA